MRKRNRFWDRTRGPRRRAKRTPQARPRRLTVETLEPRQLLSGGAPLGPAFAVQVTNETPVGRAEILNGEMQ